MLSKCFALTKEEGKMLHLTQEGKQNCFLITKHGKKKFFLNILIYSAEIEMAFRKLASTLLAMDLCNSKQLFKVSNTNVASFWE